MQDPIITPIITTALINAGLTVGVSVGTTLAIAPFVTTGLFLTGAYLANSALAQRPDTSLSGARPENGHLPIRQSIPPRIFGYGRNRIAGAYMLYEEYAGTSHDVLALCQGPIIGFVGFYLHDDPVTVGTDSFVSAGPDGRYGPNNIILQWRTGAPPVPAFDTGLDPNIWGPNHQGNGIASLRMSCASVPAEDFQRVYPQRHPEPSAVADLLPVWDPRNSGQSPENPNSWLSTANPYNPVLQIIDFLTDDDHGMGLDRATLIEPVLQELITEANYCDQFVPTVSGSELRYTHSGWWSFDTSPAEILGQMLQSCDGWIDLNGDGSLALRVGVYRAPTVTIGEKHIVGVSVDFGQEDEARVDELALSYTSPGDNYKTVSATSWPNPSAIPSRGKRRVQNLALPGVQSNSQARRLAKRAMARLCAATRGTLTTTLYGLVAAGERWVRLQYPLIPELADCVIEIRKRKTDWLNGRCTFEWSVVDPVSVDAWDPATEEQENAADPGEVDSGGLEAPSIDHLGTTGSQIDAYIVDPARPDYSYRLRYRQQDIGGGIPGEWIVQSYGAVAPIAGFVKVTTNVVTIGPIYEVQAAVIGGSGSQSGWSPTSEINT